MISCYNHSESVLDMPSGYPAWLSYNGLLKNSVNRYNEIKSVIASKGIGESKELMQEIGDLIGKLPASYRESAIALLTVLSYTSSGATLASVDVTDADLRYDPRYKELVEYFDKSAELDKRYEEFNSPEFQNRWNRMEEQDRVREERRRDLFERRDSLSAEELAELQSPLYTKAEMDERRELWRKIYELRDDTEETMDHFKQFLKKEKNNAEDAKLKKKSDRTQDEHLLLKAYEKAESELKKHEKNLEEVKKSIKKRDVELDKLHEDVINHPEKSYITRQKVEQHFEDHVSDYAKEFNKIIGGRENLQRKSKIIEVLVNMEMNNELQTFKNSLNEDISGQISEAQKKLAARSEKVQDSERAQTINPTEKKTVLPRVNPSTFGRKTEENKVYPPNTPSKKRIGDKVKARRER